MHKKTWVIMMLTGVSVGFTVLFFADKFLKRCRFTVIGK